MHRIACMRIGQLVGTTAGGAHKTLLGEQVTILCDGGQRHLSRFHNPDYLKEVGLAPSHTGRDLSFIQPTAVMPCQGR